MNPQSALYRTVWRWHFYAGLIVIPFILILSTSGAIYLFKPQIDRWEERAYHGHAPGGAASPSAQVGAAFAAHPGAAWHSYRLPAREGDAAMVHLAVPDGTMRDVFVSPDGKVLGSRDPAATISQTVARFHGSLLLGRAGDWLVELAASWAIVMILTGLYLWWPDGGRLAGVVWPRLRAGGRTAWRDLHAVTGFWVSGLALVLLLTGLPWAGVWGDAFRTLRTEMGWIDGPQEWKVGHAAPPSPAVPSPHAHHDHAAMAAQAPAAPGTGLAMLDAIVVKARHEGLAFPALVQPPGAPQSFGRPPLPDWVARSEAQDRTLVRSIRYDAVSGAETGRTGFADKHPIDRVIGYGIAWHEGALFGAVNQAIGVLTALMLAVLAATGFVLWRRRRPAGLLGAPPQPARAGRRGGVVAIVLVLAAFLPLLAASLCLLLLFDRLVLPHLPRAARWLGLERGLSS